MKVKIGNKIYDPNREPIMLILDDQDKKNIGEMLPECAKYCAFPDSSDPLEIAEWMADDNEESSECPLPEGVEEGGGIYTKTNSDLFIDRDISADDLRKIADHKEANPLEDPDFEST